jgi:hypothetical protein
MWFEMDPAGGLTSVAELPTNEWMLGPLTYDFNLGLTREFPGHYRWRFITIFGVEGRGVLKPSLYSCISGKYSPVNR